MKTVDKDYFPGGPTSFQPLFERCHSLENGESPGRGNFCGNFGTGYGDTLGTHDGYANTARGVYCS